MKFKNISFAPTLLSTVIAACLMVMCIKFGLWQYHKAARKQALQTQFDSQLQAPTAFPQAPVNIEEWRYKKVFVTGEYVQKYQFYLDNQMYGEQAGFHVLTPLKIDNANMTVLVNRGWIAANTVHAALPVALAPLGKQRIEGSVWLAPKKTFSLGSELTQWQTVWQQFNPEKVAKITGLTLSPMVVRAAKSNEGLITDWPAPVEDISKNLGYAYQWFGFALATFLLFIYNSVKGRMKPYESEQ